MLALSNSFFITGGVESLSLVYSYTEDMLAKHNVVLLEMLIVLDDQSKSKDQLFYCHENYSISSLPTQMEDYSIIKDEIISRHHVPSAAS